MDTKQNKSGKTGKNHKSKLSLKKKDPSRQTDSDGSFGDHRSSSFDFLRAITGEDDSLDQSDDFRESRSRSRSTARIPGKKTDPNKELKKSSSLNKQKSKVKPSDKVSSSILTLSGSESQKDQDNNVEKSSSLNKQKSKVKPSDKVSSSILTPSGFESQKDQDNNVEKSSLNKQKSKVKPSDKVSSSILTPSGSESQKDRDNDVDKTSDKDHAKDSAVTSCTVRLSKVPIVGKTVPIQNKNAVESQGSKTSKASLSTYTDGNVVAMESERRKCPICRKVLGDIQGSQDLDHHISQCLKTHFSAMQNTNEDEHLARQLQEREQEKGIEERLTEDGYYPCQLCHKDLSKMNSERRRQHVNRCIDIDEKDKKDTEEKEAIVKQKSIKQKARMMIPDCPICGLLLNTKLQRESHLKRCARALNVPSAQLIELVKKQEEELALCLADQPNSESEGSIGPAVAVAPAAAIARPKNKPKKRKLKPGEDIDEDTQLAIAMSASLAPDQGTSQAAGASDAPRKKGKGKKKKNIEKEVPVLLVRSDMERQILLENRLANLVAPQEVGVLERTPSLRQSKVANKKLKHLASPKRSGKPLWELSAQNDHEKVTQSPFYVPQLKDNIAVPEPGTTPKRKTSRTQRGQKDQDRLGSTQAISSTLQVLQDLEEEGAHASSSSLEASGRQRNASGFVDEASSSQAVKLHNEHEKLVLSQLSNLVNNKELSDVRIRTEDKSMVYAHKFLLHLRCPKLLQDLNESANKSVCSLDIPKDVLLSVLKYVYCGSVEVEGDHALLVVQYAQKYNLPELAKACQPILKIRSTPHKTPKPKRRSSQQEKDKDTGRLQDNSSAIQEKELDSALDTRTVEAGDTEDEDDFRNKDLNELLQNLWDDSDKESDSSSHESDEEKDPNEEEMEEIYEYASTQAKQKKGNSQRSSDELTMKTTSVDLGTRVGASPPSADVCDKSTKSTPRQSRKEKKDKARNVRHSKSVPAHPVASDSEGDKSARHSKSVSAHPVESESENDKSTSQRQSRKEKKDEARNIRRSKSVSAHSVQSDSEVEKSTKSTSRQSRKKKKDEARNFRRSKSVSAHSVESNSEGDESAEVPAVTGRLTRKGWKPISNKDSPQKQLPKSSMNTTDGNPSPRVSGDFNEQDVEMEDISDEVEKAPVQDDIQTSEDTSEIDVATSASRIVGQEPATDVENVVDLTQGSPSSTPVTRSSSSPQKKILRRSSTKTVSPKASNSKIALSSNAEKEDHPAAAAKDVADGVADDSKDQLDESVDESDTSWIIPSTPPVKQPHSKQNAFVLPQKRAANSKSSSSSNSRQSTSVAMASTPMDVRNKSSSFFGNNFLPKMSPVKIVLEKMSLDASSPSVTVSRNAETETFEITDKGSPIATSLKQKKTVNKMTENSTLLTRQNSRGNLSGQTPGSPSVDRTGTRSWKQSPSSRTRSLSQSQSPKQNLTPKGHSMKKSSKVVSPREVSPRPPKLRRTSSPPAVSKGKLAKTPVRRIRKTSMTVTDKTPDSLSKRKSSPIVIPDLPEVSNPIVLSDESTSPTPSPTFGRSSPTSVSSPAKNDDNQRRSSQEYEQPTGKPAKRKRKQSMPMRSPDKLQLTSNDAPVDTTTAGNVRSKLKQKGRMAYLSPKRYPSSYHPLKKKYKSFSPIGREAIRRRTRSFTKEPTVTRSKNLATSGTKDRSLNGTNSPTKDQTLNGSVAGGAQLSQDVPSTNIASDSPQINVTRTQEKDIIIYDILNGTEVPQSGNDGAGGEDPEVSTIRSTPDGTPDGSAGNHTHGVSTQQEVEEAMFAFDVNDGGFDDYIGNHDISNRCDHEPVEAEQYSLVKNLKIGPAFTIKSLKDIEHHEEETANVSSPHKNQANKLTTSSLDEPSEVEHYQQTGIQSSIRSLPEVGITNNNQKEKSDAGYWAHDISSSPEKQISIFSSPIITEKLRTMESFSPRLHQHSSQENEDVMTLIQVGPARSLATAPPTQQDHHFSPTGSVTSPVETTGYFGVASDSFAQEEVIEISTGRRDAVVNGNHQGDDVEDNGTLQEEVVFVPPVCSLQNSRNVAVVRPTPAVRPNVDELYHAPAPITPMPNYDDMDTPALKKQTHKYGLKPLAKKKARLKLKEIYQYTHQVLETSVDNGDSDTDNEKDRDKDTAKRKNINNNNKNKPEKPSKTQGKKVNNRSKGQGSKKVAGGTEDQDEGNVKSTMNPPAARKRKEVTEGGESSGDTSDAPSNADCPEDSILEDDDEIPMSQPLSKNPEEAVMMYIKGNEELHHRILMYEPLFLKEFQKELKEAGIVCSMLQLKIILDKQCITFRAEPSNRHVRKSKKQRTK